MTVSNRNGGLTPRLITAAAALACAGGLLASTLGATSPAAQPGRLLTNPASADAAPAARTFTENEGLVGVA